MDKVLKIKVPGSVLTDYFSLWINIFVQDSGFFFLVFYSLGHGMLNSHQ